MANKNDTKRVTTKISGKGKLYISCNEIGCPGNHQAPEINRLQIF
jgi:hypothetical protein